MAIKLNNQDQERALCAIIAGPENRNALFNETVAGLKNLDFTGGSRDAVEQCYTEVEKISNDLVDIEQSVVNLITKNIEISDQMQKAAYLQNRVSNVSLDDSIVNKKHVDLSNLG